eukprot:CAMPEP_0185724860 /NCGR_PEP_ID=MMETSP1171-20130828/1224_1 /TAXON_ID=374046 /ORGANISM="Helicotheca tamensis, Strain CCMP826" /LENGTH=796 /DNA_ID=CAMNT_0028392809 /DNA_START=83 /DNA_END=2473 /DNA_ORIENTATION=-
MVFDIITGGLLEVKDFVGDTTQKVGDVTGINKLMKPLRLKDKGDEEAEDKDATNITEHARRARVKMRNIFVKPLGSFSDLSILTTPKSDEDKLFLESALKDTFLFSYMSKAERSKLIGAMKKTSVESGATIIKQGDVADYFYVIASGTVTFVVDGKDVGEGTEGDAFGELALMYDCPRAATCLAKTACDLWRVDQNTFRKIRQKHLVRDLSEAKQAIAKVKFLQGLDDHHMQLMADAMRLQHFKAGETVFEKGSQFHFCILKEGHIKTSNVEIGGTKYEDHTLVPGDYIGERCMTSPDNLLLPGDGVAVTDGSLFVISRERFQTILGDLSLEELLAASLNRKALEFISVFFALEAAEFDALATLVENHDFPKGHVFMKEGKKVSPTLYFIRSGKVECKAKKGKDGKILSEDGHFGHDLFPGVTDVNAKVAAKETITATEDCKIGVLTLEAVESVVTDLARLSTKKKHAPRLDGVGLKSLKKHRILGAGTFGQVWLVGVKGDKNPYALKIQYKRELIGYNQVDGVLREKKIMSSLDHPFVIGLLNSYQDEQCIYMLMQLVQGGEMHNVIYTDTRDGVSEDVAKFYAANILEGLSHMHSKSIIHRDLKFENVLMDKDGFCVLIDLGFAKCIRGRTYTFCGTPLFIAPEVVTSKGHDTGADIWSWGVMIYEMVVGQNPFYDGYMDQMALFKAISRGKFNFPSDIILTKECKDLIKSLLIVDPSFRLGCYGKGLVEIRSKEWFSGTNFRKILNKECKAPWVPTIKDAFDATNFDDWKDLEKQKKKLKPLSQKEQAMFEGF